MSGKICFFSSWLFIFASFCLENPRGFSQQSDPFPALLQALQKGNREEAGKILGTVAKPFTPEERTQVSNAIDRLSPGADWIPFLQKLVEKNETDGEIIFILARAYWRSGDIDSAIRECERAVKKDANNKILLYRCAALAQTLDRIENAQRWLTMLLNLDPENVDGLYLLGRIQASQGETAAAKQSFLHVIQLKPNHYLANYELGLLENRQGNAAAAETYLRNAVKGYPFFREAYNSLIMALARQNKTDEIKRVKKIVDYLNGWEDAKESRLRNAYQNPAGISLKDSYELAAELYSVDREDLAKTLLERLLLEKRVAEPHLILLAQFRYHAQEYEGCLKLLELIKTPILRSTETYVVLQSWSLYLLGRMEESKKVYQESILKFKDSEPLKKLAQAFTQSPAPARIASATVSSASESSFYFIEVTEKSGLSHFHHILGNPDKSWIVDAMGSGVAVGDYDNDGDDDIYFVNGRPNLDQPDPKWRNALFRNDNEIFTDVTESAGVGDTGFGMCAVWGDVNNDGWLDLYVGNYGPNVLYKNNGNGTFTDITVDAGVGDPGYAAATAFADVDQDGDLDLFVGNYVNFELTRDSEKRSAYHGMQVFSGPLAFQPQKSVLYFNDSSGKFTDNSETAKIHTAQGRAMSAVFFDFENDGDLDLYVTNDSTYNFVFLNQGKGIFEDISFESGGAFNDQGVEGGSMGVTSGDYNNDGFLDLFITSYEHQTDVLYKNNGQKMLLDDTGPMGLLGPSNMLITWGDMFCDFNADGLLDIFTADGHLYPQVEKLGLNRKYNQGVSFYQNTGKRFNDVSKTMRLENYIPKAGRGAALLDYDRDGDMDIVINNIDSTPTLLENRTPPGHWLQVDLKGTSAQTYGTRVVARRGTQTWTRMVDGGSGYLSQSSSTLHFGFGSVDQIDDITVHWFHTKPQIIEHPKLDTRITIKPER